MRAEEKRVRIELDMYQTMAVAVLALMLGRYLRKKCWLLEDVYKRQLLCSYRGGSQGLSPTYEQAHVGLDLLTLAS